MTDRRSMTQAGVAAAEGLAAWGATKETTMAQGADILPFDVPQLRFGWDALEPAVSADALRAHHEGVHKGYADAVNRLLAPYPELASKTVEQVLGEAASLPPEIRDAAVDLAGAHANHQFLWKVVGPAGGSAPGQALAEALARDLGGFDRFKADFERAALGLEGPGFAFLSLAAPKTDRLEVVVLPGNGSVLTEAKPGVLVCDLWDHAWAADHPDRAAWLEAFWTIVDWGVCKSRYLALRDGRQPE